MKDKVLAYWRGLKDQEQRLLLVAGGVFVIFVLYMGVVKPLQDGIKNAQKELQQQTELLAWVQESVVKLKASTPKQAQSNQSLSQVVNSTRGRYNINIAKIQPKTKLEKINSRNVLNEASFMQIMQGHIGIPLMQWSGVNDP